MSLYNSNAKRPRKNNGINKGVFHALKLGVLLYIILNMKKFVLLLAVMIGLPSVICAQTDRDMPHWITKLPSANPNKHYYYRVTMGEGDTYDKAYAKAFAKAVIEAKWKLGVRVNVSDDMTALEGQVTEAINVQEQVMTIPINKVCDWWEDFYSSTSKKQVRLYVLWQIADDGRFEPKFEEYTNCQ